ncbi:MAG: orotidine-5'-phosphate decarboxylase [Candidatus Krumholzibacteria bacterium]|nr:orotidine-5'-phosphate decarboxylase [Candidatus Krumholzibacteria bacterium]
MNESPTAPRVIVALDVEDSGRALELVSLTSPAIGLYKIGSRLFTYEGPSIVREIAKLGASVFLDLKFHDIPATVEGSVRAATALGVAMMTVHASGGVDMMRSAAEAASEESERLGIERPLVVGVTVLTSLSMEDLSRTFGSKGAVRDVVLHLASQARESGLDGVVASVEETRLIKDAVGVDFKVVTPGIRPSGADAGDQKRVATPRAAREAGSDFLVVGRPIIGASDPLKAAEGILRELKEA